MIWSFKCIVGDMVWFRKNILAEIILKKCIFNAVCKEVSLNYAPKPENRKLYISLNFKLNTYKK